jgi:hypothetical protein
MESVKIGVGDLTVSLRPGETGGKIVRRKSSIVLTLVLITLFGMVAIPTASACGGEGCTPGYWRQVQHFDAWEATGYEPVDSFDAVFGVDSSFGTLLDGVKAKGGGEKALARHAVAALLNASSPYVSYEYSPAQVIALVQGAYACGNFEAIKDLLEYQNELGCNL